MNFLLHQLWHWLMFGSVLMFAAGSSALADTMGGETGGDNGGTDGGDSGAAGAAAGAGEAGDSAGAEGGDGGAADGQRLGTDAGAGGADQDPAADGRKMPASLRSHIAELKKSNPALAKEINGLYWRGQAQQAEVQKHFPGGIKEAIALKQQVEDIGGLDTVAELNEEVQDYRNVDQALIKGDPAFIAQLPAEVKQGFYRMMPQFLSEFAQAEPESYDRYFAGVMFNTLRDNEFSTDLRLIAEHLSQYDQEKNPGIKQALSLLDKSQKFIGGLKTMAGTPAKNQDRGTDRQATQLEEREAQLNDRERKATLRSIGQETSAFVNPKIDQLVKQLAKGRTLPEGGIQQVRSDAMRAAMQLLAGDRRDGKGNHLPSEFERKYDSYLDHGDRAGAAKLLKSRLEPLLEEQTRKAYKRLYGEATLGAQKTGADKGKGNDAAARDKGKATGDASFALIGYNPKPSSIDYSKTSRAMIFQNQAILKNGKKVSWRNDAPGEK